MHRLHFSAFLIAWIFEMRSYLATKIHQKINNRPISKLCKIQRNRSSKKGEIPSWLSLSMTPVGAILVLMYWKWRESALNLPWTWLANILFLEGGEGTLYFFAFLLLFLLFKYSNFFLNHIKYEFESCLLTFLKRFELFWASNRPISLVIRLTGGTQGWEKMDLSRAGHTGLEIEHKSKERKLLN